MSGCGRSKNASRQMVVVRASYATGILLFISFGCAASDGVEPGSSVAGAATAADAGTENGAGNPAGDAAALGGAGIPGLLMATGEEGIELHGELPSSVPLFPSAVPISLLDLGPGGVQVGFLSDSTADSIQGWYVEELEEKDWEIDESMVEVQGGTILANKGQASLLVLISGEHDTRQARVTVVLTYREAEGR